jgi:hypothetical protein
LNGRSEALSAEGEGGGEQGAIDLMGGEIGERMGVGEEFGDIGEVADVDVGLDGMGVIEVEAVVEMVFWNQENSVMIEIF